MAFGDILAKNPKPADDDAQGKKNGWATKFARGIAMELSAEFRERGAANCMPDPSTGSGGERRFAGGIGAKQVDVSLASEEFGLAMAVSLKGIYFPDASALNASGKEYFAKNLMNRKGDMLAEGTTLHKRFPYAVLGGIFLFDERAAVEKIEGKSTYLRAHDSFSAFTGRISHSDAEEKFECFALGLITSQNKVRLHWVGNPKEDIQVKDFVERLLAFVAQRNADHFSFVNGRLVAL